MYVGEPLLYMQGICGARKACAVNAKHVGVHAKHACEGQHAVSGTGSGAPSMVGNQHARNATLEGPSVGAAADGRSPQREHPATRSLEAHLLSAGVVIDHHEVRQRLKATGADVDDAVEATQAGSEPAHL